ncbi:MAG: hypothetical protein HGA96_05200 [Desulfobulbaceae bacterium]|nr:hypothetical protein [Desulfobulbaceae bacterium]
MPSSVPAPIFVLLINWSLGKGLPPAVILPGVAVVTLATVALQHGAAELNHQPQR